MAVPWPEAPLLSNCASGDATDSIKWDKEADVVVIGYGGAGVSAAISASDAGANVLVIEKNEKGGGSTCVSGGGFIVSEDTAACNKYVQAILDDSLTVEDPAVVKTYTDATGTIVDYLGEILLTRSSPSTVEPVSPPSRVPIRSISTALPPIRARMQLASSSIVFPLPPMIVA